MILAFVAAVLALVAVGSFCLSWYVMRSAMRGRRHTMEEIFERQKKRYDISWFRRSETEDYVVKSDDGYVLHATHVPCGADAGRFVILTHGHEDNRWRMLRYVKLYLDLRFDCILYDLRDHGENERCFCTYSLRESRDLVAVIDDARRRFGGDITLGLHGESLGAATTVRALMYKPDVAFAVADCGFSDIENVLEGMLREKHVPMVVLKLASRLAKRVYGYGFEEMRPIEALPVNRVPVLFIHGAEDRFILPENSVRMHQACGGYSELLIVPGARHANSVLTEPELYAERVAAFLSRIGQLPNTIK